MEEEKVTITLNEVEADRGVDMHLLGPRGEVDEERRQMAVGEVRHKTEESMVC